MSAPDAFNQFLASVEKRAFAMALMSVRDADEALDIVQDAMFTLARKYASKPAEEWPPLFYRILRNRMTDYHRAVSVRSRVFGWIGRKSGNDVATERYDSVDNAPAPEAANPHNAAVLEGMTDKLHNALADLPGRQREAFMLRSWEGLDVRETAAAMGCSGGSVKTHYSRAVKALRISMEEFADV